MNRINILNKKKIYVIIMFVLFISLGLGYAYLSSSLAFNGKVTVKKDKTIYNLMARNSTLDTGIDFSSPSITAGIYEMDSTKDNTNPVYYYRGEVTNNNVKFANFCWKIVRTTETGGVKLIYNGTPAADGSCNNTGEASQAGKSLYNAPGPIITQNGYMYYGKANSITSRPIANSESIGVIYGNSASYTGAGGYTLSDTFTSTNGWATDYATIGSKYHYTCHSTSDNCNPVYYMIYVLNAGGTLYSYEIPLENGQPLLTLQNMVKGDTYTQDTSSTIKKFLDEWYLEFLNNYTDQLEDAIWYNDRSIFSYGGFDKDTPNSMNMGTASLKFNGYNRNNTTYSPNLEYVNNTDKFTVSTENGNGLLTYPVGLITADEATLAGNGVNGDSSSYLTTGSNFWTNTPFQISSSLNNYIVTNNGKLSSSPVSSFQYGVRPMLSLKAGTKYTSGDGTATSPYIVE